MSELTNKKDQETLEKMLKYIDRFSFSEEDFSSLRAKLTQDALMAQEQGVSLKQYLGKGETEYCDQLVEEKRGYKIPKEEKILYMISNLFLIVGAIAMLSTIINIVSLFAILGVDAIAVYHTTFVILILKNAVYILAGYMGKKYSGNYKRLPHCILMGVILLILNILLLIIHFSSAYILNSSGSQYALNTGVNIFWLLFGVVYLVIATLLYKKEKSRKN